MSNEYLQIADIYPLLKNPRKYTGVRPITMRSSWESKFVLQYLDINDAILEWKSEVPIPYICGTDGRRHRYFVDFWVRAKKTDGSVGEMLIEIKPYNQTLEPQKPKRVTKGALNGLRNWVKNSSKWKATNQLVEAEKKNGKNIEFVIITEKDAPWFLK